MKQVFTIDPDIPFLECLASELWKRAEGDNLRLSQMQILLPTRRACRHLGATFARIANGKPVLLPRMSPLGDIDEDEIAFADESFPDLLPAIGPLRRLMLLTQHVQRRDTKMSYDQALLAADALARFLDQVKTERCDVDRLPGLVLEQELAEHWQQTLQFLDIVTQNWPIILAENASLDPVDRRNLVMEAQAKLWREKPPSFPVIAAGSTGSILATSDLLEVIADLSQGAVILPGLDRHLNDQAWDAIDDTHPQYSMKNLLRKLDIDRRAIRDWGTSSRPSPRVQLMSEVMRPAAVTDDWRTLRDHLPLESIKGLGQLTLDHPQEEAQVIALHLRALLEQPNKTAAFITADRSLAVRVTAALTRWNIEVDDSGGASLATLPIGSFLTLVLAAASPQAGAVDRLALLKHPFAACGLSPANCRANARLAEVRLRMNEKEDFEALREQLAPLTDEWKKKKSLRDLIHLHLEIAETISRSDTETGASRLWGGDVGNATTEWLDEWRESGNDFPALAFNDYEALFTSLARTKIMRSTHGAHPRLSILGPLEARLIHADLIILGGMNEGSWPPDAGFDPWMSRPMRKKFGLPSPEFRIGLSAHDFAQLACAPEVLLTRSLRTNGTPTVPSRFLLQLDAVLRAAGLTHDTHDALQPTDPWRAWAQLLDAPSLIQSCERPQPRPPLDARPKSLSVTEISTWQRNPYAIYARHILKLKKLEDLDAELDASDRGQMIHDALEQFVTLYPTTMPDDAEEKLMEIGRIIFAKEAMDPRIFAFWWANFTTIAGWFIVHERERRLTGTTVIGVEHKGQMVLDGFTLRGRADRFDRLKEGTLAIIDYKTGGVPSKAEIKSGIEPQLQLLALIASEGGFGALAHAETASLEYWILKGTRSGSKADSLTTDIPDLIDKAREGLRQLILEFSLRDTPYEAVPKPRLQPRYNDYAHLARLAEWGRTAEDL